MRIGDRVYIKELGQIGHVAQMTVVRGHPVVAKVRINTPTGPEIIDVLQYTVQIVTILNALLPLVKRLINNIKKLFKS